MGGGGGGGYPIGGRMVRVLVFLLLRYHLIIYKPIDALATELSLSSVAVDEMQYYHFFD